MLPPQCMPALGLSAMPSDSAPSTQIFLDYNAISYIHMLPPNYC